MGVVTLAPFVLLIDIRAETRLIWVYHELFDVHCLLILIKVLRESPVTHQSAHGAAFLRAKWQGIYLLFFFIKGLNPVDQIAGIKWMQLIRWWVLAIHNDKRSIKVRWTIYLKLICKGISLEPVSITFQKENMKTYFFAFWVLSSLIVIFFLKILNRGYFPGATYEPKIGFHKLSLP